MLSRRGVTTSFVCNGSNVLDSEMASVVVVVVFVYLSFFPLLDLVSLQSERRPWPSSCFDPKGIFRYSAARPLCMRKLVSS